MGRSRILVIDDEPEIRSTIADILVLDGHDVQTAEDGRDGLERIGRNQFDLILSDMRMPEMDGQALYEHLRHDHPQALRRIAFITGQAHDSKFGVFLKDTGAPVLGKPFTMHQLRELVDQMNTTVMSGEYAMNNEVAEKAREAEMMAVIEDIVKGSRGLVRDWTLLEDAETALQNGGLDGLVRFYRAYTEQPGSRATWIKATLQANGKSTLESEYKRFMAIYSGDSG